MDVVLLEGDHVVAAGEVESPVVVTVAGGGPGGRAVNLVVGDGDTVRGAVAENNVLAADQGGLDVVDPDKVGAVESDGITAPDVLGVQVGDVDVLAPVVSPLAGMIVTSSVK